MLEPCLMQGFISEPNIRIKTKGLADCITQTASPFVCLNNLSQKYCLTFWGHFTGMGDFFGRQKIPGSEEPGIVV